MNDLGLGLGLALSNLHINYSGGCLGGSIG